MIVDLPPERYAECLKVLHAGFSTVASEFGLTAENTPSNPAFWTEGEVERVVSRGNQAFAVEIDRRLLGCAFAGPSGSRPATWVLRHLAVVPEWRHQGYGEALVREAARRAWDAHARVLRIGIVAASTRLSDWYQALGFVTVEHGRRYPSLVFEVDHLELMLSQFIDK